MKYVSIAQSRAGWKPEDEATPKAKRKREVTPETSVEPAANTNPDGDEPVSQSEEG